MLWRYLFIGKSINNQKYLLQYWTDFAQMCRYRYVRLANTLYKQYQLLQYLILYSILSYTTSDLILNENTRTEHKYMINLARQQFYYLLIYIAQYHNSLRFIYELFITLSEFYKIIAQPVMTSLNEPSREDVTMKQQLLTDQERSTRTRSTIINQSPEVQPRRKAKNMRQTFVRLFKYSMNYKCIIFSANFAMLVSSGGMIILPMLCGTIIDHIKNQQSLRNDALKFLALTLIMAVFSAIRGYSFNLLGEKIVRDMRIQLFYKLVKKDISYYDKNKTGELISRLTSDVSTVEGAASDNISILLRNLIQFFGSLVFLYVISWQLTTFIIIVTPIISFAIIAIIRISKRLKKQYQNTLAFANSLANQVFGNIRVVRSFSNQQHEHQNYTTLLNKTYATGRRRALIYAIMLLAMTLFGNFLILSILYFGGQLTIQGKLSIGDLASFVLYTVTLTVGFSSVSGIINQIVSALGVCQTLFQIMDDPIQVTQGSQKAILDGTQNIVQFVNVTFAYPTKPDVKVLKNFNLKIKKGESIALVGSSGSGKSSIISLILRFYDIQQGTILIGGKDIKDLDLHHLRKQIGFVSQEPTLFSGSLRQNIQYGLENHQKKDEKIMRALQIANAKNFALNSETFPDKLDTLVGQRGVKLSGGQKQRIAIARSVIKEPKLLIFDEATSALDAESESLVQKAIDKLVQAKQNTMIVVAHRLSTIINCDRIGVIKDGKLVQDGSHWQLLKKNGVYKSLIQKQISGYNNIMKSHQEKIQGQDKNLV